LLGIGVFLHDQCPCSRELEAPGTEWRMLFNYSYDGFMKRFFLTFLFLVPCLTLLAQESNCGDGIDNDGDGFIDCFDGDCANSVTCKDFYVGRDKVCQSPPTGVAKFGMKLSAKSPDRTTWTSGRMAIGDLDDDGIPEMITLHPDDKTLYILNGTDLTVKHTGTISATAEYFDHMIGKVTAGSCAYIFIAEKEGSTYYVTAFDCNGVQKWRNAAYGEPITMGLADFDQDGKAELYYRNEILDAATGLTIVKGSGSWTAIDAGPVAVDMLANSACANCAGLELVLGGTIYAVNLGTHTLNSGSLTLAKSIPSGASYYPKNTAFGFVTSTTSVADYNQDGSLDVLMSGATGSTGGTTAVFFWDVQNNTYKIYKPSNNWKHGTGRINIADLDGDGKSNATFVSGSKLFALKEDFTTFWSIDINESTSGYTSTTVFDFNNDGAVEVVYRDEAYLYIINGKTGSVFTQATCRSRTANDYPIVVDVDGDGATEICVTCATNDADDITQISRAPYGQVRTYKSNLEAWVPARKVWNQHGYFNVNVNDDLTIPRYQQKHNVIFSTGACTPGSNRALNTFLNQSPYLDSKGCPTYATADITYDAASVIITPPTCPDQAFTVSLDIKNIGDLGLSGDLPITFYQGDPTKAGAVKLNTQIVTLTKFNVGDVASLTNLTVQGTGSSFTLYVVLNDNGSTVPTPISLPNSTFSECNYTNNIVSASVNPKPFTIQTALISDDFKCGTGSTPPNGAAEVFRQVSGSKVTAGYTFYWFDGTTVADTSLAVFKGPVRTGLAAGTYSIIAYHQGVKCASSSAQVVVGQQTRTLTASIAENKPFTSCKNPDGKLTVTMNGGDPVGNYTYEWFEGNVFGTSPILSTSHVITNVSAVTYSVLVTEKATGCQILESAKVTDKTTSPVVTASTTDANCSPANSGSASANVGGSTTNYTFNWYTGSSAKPSPDFTGSSYTNITAGNYTVVAVSKSSGCSSSPVVVTVASKQTVPVATTITAQQTSCTTPNGSGTASVGGTTAGYTFKWFVGNNTLPANLIGSTASIAGLAAGVYTVEATSASTGCVDTEIMTINDVIVIPVIAASVTSQQTQCTPFNGAVAASTTSPGSYTFYWFNGNIGTPDTLAANFKGAAYTGLKAGFYTVVTANKFTRCVSARAVVQVLDNTVIPVISTTTVDQTSCSAASLSGQASANVGGNTSNFKFRWFSGADTSVFISQGASITNRAAGTYTVKAITLATKCFSTQQVTIKESLVNPTVTQTIANNINCSGVTPTGSITIQINGGLDPLTDFTIKWFEGNGITTPLGTTVGSVTGTNNETAQALSAGTYTVSVKDNTVPGVGCSTTKTFTITDTPAVVTIDNPDIALTPQSNCSPVNGSATVNEITVNGVGIGNTTGYTFTWYQSNGTTVIAGSGASATIGVALAAGNYFVRATNTTTNCKSPVTAFTISDTHVNPAITAATTTNNTNCSGVTANGLITINVGGVVPAAGQYNIEWFEGNGTTTVLGTTVGSVSGVSNETAQGLPAGSYTVRVTDLVTPDNGCSTTKTFTITDTPAVVTIDNPDIVLTPQSNCSPLNGSATVNEITVNGVGIGNTTGYTFTWYQSNGTTVIAGSGTSATIGVALAAGNYFVRATNTTSNCKSPVTAFAIIDTHVSPTVALLAPPVNNTNCSTTPNGSITIQVNGGADPVTDFTIEWFEGNGISKPLGTTVGTTGGLSNEIAQAISGGTYTVRVRDNVAPNAGCLFIASFAITDNPSFPTPAGTPSANTACDPLKSNGSIIADVGGTTVGYTFHIFRGQNTLPANEVTSGPAIASNLDAGVYTVQAITNASGCAGTTEVSVTNNIVLPTIDATTSTDVTSCSSPDGSVSVTAVSIGAVADYTFSWFDGNALKAIPDYTGSTVNNLLAGNYTVTATNNVLGCDVQVPVTVTVSNDPSTLITINELPFPEKITPAICNDGLGQIAASASSPANLSGFTFSWYLGDKNIGMALEGIGSDFGVNSNRISLAASGESIISGLHTVIAVDNTTGCQDSLVIHLPYSDEAALLSILTTPQTDCLNPDGGFDATITPSAGTVAAFPLVDQSWYELRVYQKGILITTSPGVEPAPTTISALAAGNYTVLAVETDPSLPGCSSAPNDINIGDNRAYPVITPDVLVENRNCAGSANDTGSISLTIDGVPTPGAGYSYSWFDGKLNTDPAIAPANIVAPGHSVVNIDGGFYTVEVTSASNNCKAEETLYLNNTPFVISVSSADLSLTPQSDCSPANGSADVTDVLIDGASSGGTGGYTFQWFQNDGTTIIPSSSSTASVGTAIGADTYFVKATNTASNCTSPLVQFTIQDVSVAPVITQNTLIDNTNCSGAPANGSITINVDGAVPAVTDYTIQWYTGVGTGSLIAGATTETLSNVGAGDYTVEVIDILSPGNTCSSVSVFSILDTPNNIGIDLSDISIADNSDCLPINGSATVTNIILNGIKTGSTAGFTFEWLKSDLTTVDPGNGPTVGIPLNAASYYVRTTQVASGCISASTPFEIKDVTTIPVVVAATDVDNVACNTSYTGQVSASVSEGLINGITVGYQFEWFAGKNNTNPVDFINTGAVQTGLREGDYTVRVTDVSTPSGNCSNTASVTIKREIPVMNGTLTANAQTVCSPIQDGSLSVNNVQQFLGGISSSFDMSNAVDRNKFSFQWFDENLAAVSPAVVGNAVSPNLEEGTFYVQVSDALGCTSDYIKGVIDDQTAKPLIALDEFTNPAICILPEVKGSLIVSADNQANFSDYTFTWFEGNGTAGTVVEPNSSFLGNINYTDTQEYTVKVINNATQCFSLETYKFKADTVDIQVVASAVPLTSCVTDNGSLFAATRTGSGQLYNIEWYIGGSVGTVPDFTSNQVLVAPIGLYTAVAKHPTLNFCNSIPDTISVTDGRVYPLVTATQKAPLTYCDPANPNGVAFATVGGSIIGYTFDWYEGSIAGTLAYTGTEAGVLKATTYSIKATDVISGCTGLTSIMIDSDPFSVPLPEINVISNRTDCLALDGALSADVNGLTKDHTFNWYDGTSVKNQADATGEFYQDLDAGVYTVTATDRITGCTSGGVQKEVLAIMEYPAFDVKAVNANCNEDTGTAALVQLGAADIKDIEWNISGVIALGPQVSALPPGNFTVIARSFRDCETEKTFEVKNDINIYNGVSRNNDGLNDFFEIGCISDFPNNSVRIYNRAGTLVFEAGGYDNQDVYFNGVSNRGISILGHDLPDGTYFYIISKGDGSETKTGYLELMH